MYRVLPPSPISQVPCVYIILCKWFVCLVRFWWRKFLPFAIALAILCRWYWAVKMGEEVALLPNIVALQVEKHITEHRRQRRILAEKKPAKWEEKLASINGKILSFVYNKKTCAMATSRFVKSKTAVIDGQTQVIGNTKAYEVINIKFELDIPGAPAGLGKYFPRESKFRAKAALLCFHFQAVRQRLGHAERDVWRTNVAKSCYVTYSFLIDCHSMFWDGLQSLLQITVRWEFVTNIVAAMVI